VSLIELCGLLVGGALAIGINVSQELQRMSILRGGAWQLLAFY
jgi:hypothetical protein